MSRAVARRDNSGGGGIFVYSCSHTVKTIAFKRKLPGRTRIYDGEYATPPPPPPIIGLVTALNMSSSVLSYIKIQGEAKYF